MLRLQCSLLAVTLTLACAPAGDGETAANTTTANTTTSNTSTANTTTDATTVSATAAETGELPTGSLGSSGDDPATSSSSVGTSTGADGGTRGESTGDPGTSTGAVDPGPECAALPYPEPCLDDAVTLPEGAGSPGPHGVVVATLKNPNPDAPGDVTVYLPDLPGKVPVMFFGHAFAATDPKSYLDLSEMLASNGIAVVHVPYPTKPPGVNTNEVRYTCLWDGFLAATVAHADVLDLTRVGFAGHSFGGGATPEMARRGFVEHGWGKAGRFMFILAPWYSWGVDYETLPVDVRTVIEVYADDDKNDHQIAVADIWEHLPPGIERAWLMLRSDACGCGLNATHTTPMTRQALTPNPQNVLNAHDRWGVWRRVHALAQYAFTDDPAMRAIAYGEDTAMGHWQGCDGAPVRPLEHSETTPITSECLDLVFPLAERCMNADPDYPCR